MNHDTPRLERPDLFAPNIWQPFQRVMARRLLRAEAIASKRTCQPNIAILIRTKNDAKGLPYILNNIDTLTREYTGRIDVIVVDTESADDTVAIAREFGATVVPLKQDTFTYPKSLNEGLAAVESDVVAAYLTVGHALPALSNTYSAAASLFENKEVSGVYANVLTSEHSTWIEKLFGAYPIRRNETIKQITKSGMGVLGATNAMIRMSVWRTYPFDETYEAGGEDTAWSRAAMKRGEVILREPATSVHHSHGLGLLKFIKQYIHWLVVSGKPKKFNAASIAKRR